MVSPAPDDVRAAAAQSRYVAQVVDLLRWVGAGRKLTSTGALTLADARVLVEALGTGDAIDPTIGDRTFRTKSSAELTNLGLVVAWARAAGLARVVKGRLVPVKKSTGLLEDPAGLWLRMFEVFPRLEPTFLPAGWGESFLRKEFSTGAEELLSALHGRDGALGLDELNDLAWDTATARYILDHATAVQLETARRCNDRDVRRTLATLTRLGAVTLTEESAELTAAGRYASGRRRGQPDPGEPVRRILVTLDAVAGPPVWRRLAVPAATPLNRLHEVLQAAMGWEDGHLHCFDDGQRTYGFPDRESDFLDERTIRFADLDPTGTLAYVYDFGDEWRHTIVVESIEPAETGGCYPRCLGGAGACPPEDCGGPPGYERLRAALADPDDPEHEEMLTWLGLDNASDFDPGAFDVEAANGRLRTVAVSR